MALHSKLQRVNIINVMDAQKDPMTFRTKNSWASKPRCHLGWAHDWALFGWGWMCNLTRDDKGIDVALSMNSMDEEL